MATHSTTSEATPPDEDPIAGLVRLFVTDYQVVRIRKGECPARRAVFRRFHGGAYGNCEILADLPDELRVGVFAHRGFRAFLRFSSDQQPDGPDAGQENGVGIKLFGVPGRKLTEHHATTHDFVLQNIPRFFVDDAQAMYDFSLDADAYQKTHPETTVILNEMTAPVGSVGCIPYWSCLPSKFGDDRFVKYALLPDDADTLPTPPLADDYLARDLNKRLVASELSFTFAAQFYVDDDATPLDRATVNWSPTAPMVPLARVVLPAQDIDSRGQAEYADNLSFTAWHALPEHEPVGSLQLARRAVYAASASARRWANGIPDEEPRERRMPLPPYPP